MTKLNGSPLINLSPQVINIDRYLCKKYKELEWCGILFYTEEGSISDPDNYSINVNYLYPMDVGSPGFTSIEQYEDVIDAMDKYPELENMRQGFIHSHNSMDTFFSGTDVSQLIDGAKDYDYFLSVITNNEAEYIARISFNYEINRKIGINKHESKTVTELGYYDCNISIDCDEIDEFLIKRIEEIDKNKTVQTSNWYKSSMNGLNSHENVQSYWNKSYSDTFVLSPEFMLPLEFIEMYHLSLYNPSYATMDQIKDLVEGCYDKNIKESLNKSQQANADELTYKWIGLIQDLYFTGKNKVKFSKKNTTDITDYLDKTLNNNAKIVIDDNNLLDAMPTMIDLLKDYTIDVVYEAYRMINNACMSYNNTFSSEVLNASYCYLLALIAVNSKFNIKRIQDEFNTNPLPKEVIDVYSKYLDGLSSTEGLNMPYNYYSNYYY